MKTNNIRLITFVALVSILFLQGMWLYTTYKFLETEFKENVSSLFITSVEKEALSRTANPVINEKKEEKNIEGEKKIVIQIKDSINQENQNGIIIEGLHPKNDHYTNNRALQDFLYKKNYPISLEKLDSIFVEEYKTSFDKLDYSFSITDSAGNKINYLSHGVNLNEPFAYKETIQLRNIAPEYITLVISSPYKIIFGEMLLLLIGSFLVAILVGYGLILQVRIIGKQDKIAKLRQDFTHSMIHDMKNPVTSILMGVNSLKEGIFDDKPEMKKRFYSIITQEGERILRLSNKILEIAHFEGQQVNLAKEEINLQDMLESLKEKQSAKASKKVHFHFDLNGVETVYGDPHYIYEAFDNLIDNAIKYSKENEDADITVICLQKENTTQLTFKDKGIGISEKDQKKIFEKFERATAVINSRKKISGFGLGLNFVFQVIQAHVGTIKVNSRLGSYSEFIINLPTNENDKTAID